MTCDCAGELADLRARVAALEERVSHNDVADVDLLRRVVHDDIFSARELLALCAGDTHAGAFLRRLLARRRLSNARAVGHWLVALSRRGLVETLGEDRNGLLYRLRVSGEEPAEPLPDPSTHARR
jgi:hypothetical protein